MIGAAAIVALLLLVMLAWAVDQAGCSHESVRGLANYFDEDRQVYVHLKQCDGCGDQFITTER
jgi:hypothetical protein